MARAPGNGYTIDMGEGQTPHVHASALAPVRRLYNVSNAGTISWVILSVIRYFRPNTI
jgi:hypothetical protein